MATYSYRCTNLSCLHEFEIDKPMAEAQHLVFCPKCHSMSERRFMADIRSILMRVQRGNDGRYYAKHRQADHVHHGGCGCQAVATDWVARLEAIEQEENESS